MVATSHAPNRKELTRDEFRWRIQILPRPGHFPGGRQPGWVIHTSGTRSLGHQQDLTLLLAGSLLQVALVLVGVTVGAAHGHVIIVTLMEGTQSSSVSHAGRGTEHFWVPHTPSPVGRNSSPAVSSARAQVSHTLLQLSSAPLPLQDSFAPSRSY